MKANTRYQIDQKFTKVKRPQTNGKAENGLSEHSWICGILKETFKSQEERKQTVTKTDLLTFATR
jgi:hypothetical protein